MPPGKRERIIFMGTNNKKSLVKDIAILLLVWIPLLFILIGGFLWTNDKFDGTIMEKLFPALFFGFLSTYFVIIITSNLFPDHSAIWFISGPVVGITTVILEMCNAHIASLVIFSGCCIGLVVLLLFKWLKRLFDK